MVGPYWHSPNFASQRSICLIDPQPSIFRSCVHSVMVRLWIRSPVPALPWALWDTGQVTPCLWASGIINWVWHCHQLHSRVVKTRRSGPSGTCPAWAAGLSKCAWSHSWNHEQKWSQLDKAHASCFWCTWSCWVSEKFYLIIEPFDKLNLSFRSTEKP